MIRTVRFSRVLAIVLAGLLACMFEPSTRGQVFDDQVEDEANVPASGAVIRHFMIAETNFDQAVFGNARNATTALARIESMAKLKINEIDQVARLTEAQKKKLELASRGDIRRFFDQVDERRKAFRDVQNDQQKYALFYPTLQPLRMLMAQGLFGEKSMFAKTVKKTLDDRQVAEYDSQVRSRLLLGQQARIGLVLVTMDNNIGLNISQRRQLLKLIVEETRPPRVTGNMEIYAVLLQLSRVPEERIKPIFQDAQWKLVQAQFDFAKRYEQVMARQGVLASESDPERWIVPVDSEAPKSD